MKDDALFRVTAALRDRLQPACTNAGFGSIFVGPLDDADSQGAPLILFLYRIVPNASLRNRVRRVPSSNRAGIDEFRNSIPLDLYFLITVGTTPLSSEETLLKALGLAMRTLQVDSELTGPVVDFETVRVTLEPLTTEEASRIWALFPTANYRTSVAYLASPVWIDPPSPEPQGPPVIDDRLLAGSILAEARS